MKNLFSLLKKIDKKYLIGGVLILLLIISLVLNSYQTKTKRQGVTEPVIPTNISPISNTSSSEKVSDSNPINPQQTINYNWNNHEIKVPDSILGYKISTSLINNTIIPKLAETLGFSTTDKIKTLNETSYMWKTETAGIFASIDQNQIFYQKYDIPKHFNNVNKEDAIKTADALIVRLFGEDFTNTLSKNRDVRFLNLVQGIYDAQNINVPEKANLIEIGYRQVIDSKPIVALSGSSNAISLTLDTENNLYKFDIYGGYLATTPSDKINLINFSDLKKIAPQKSRRISNVASVSHESAFLSASIINVDVQSVELGYFQRNDNILYPVFIISGIMSAKNLPDTSAEFLVPAAK